MKNFFKNIFLIETISVYLTFYKSKIFLLKKIVSTKNYAKFFYNFEYESNFISIECLRMICNQFKVLRVIDFFRFCFFYNSEL